MSEDAGAEAGLVQGPPAPEVLKEQLDDTRSSHTCSLLASKASRSPGQVKVSA